MKRLVVAAIRCSLMFLLPTVAYAASALWDLDPISGDWNTAANWTPNGVPNGPADIATFGLSNTTDVSISANTEVNGITFTVAATNPYTITASPGLTLNLSGVGITNGSGVTQNFVAAAGASFGSPGQIVFANGATAGNSTIFTNKGAMGFQARGGITTFFDTSTAANGSFTNNAAGCSTCSAGETRFHQTSTAGNGTFVNDGSFVSDGIYGRTVFMDNSTAGNGTFTNNAGIHGGGLILFLNSSTAGSGTFINNGNAVSGPVNAGFTVFDDASNADNGVFINNGGTVSGALGGAVEFDSFATAANGTFINNGGTVSGARGGQTFFSYTSTAGNSTLIASSGMNGGLGGTIRFIGNSTGGTARVEVFGNGSLDISEHFLSPLGVTVGSIEGDGNVFLGANNLKAGSNDLSTTFSGVIQDGGSGGGIGGSLTKIGTGTLILSGANTYTGDTNINRGVLQVDGSITSNTFVHSGGSLAGTGNIHGNVRTFRGGTVAPGELPSTPGTLNISGNYGQSAGKLLIEIATASLGDYSVLNVLGTAHLGGALDPLLLNGFIPTVGEEFTFLNYGSALGGFSRIEDQTFNNGTEHWATIYQPTDAILIVRSGPAPVPDQGATFLLMILGLLGLVTYQRRLARKQS